MKEGKGEPLLRFRMMTPEQVATGRLDVGRLVVAADEEEALGLARPGEVPVRLLSVGETSKRRLDQRMNDRARRDEEDALKRQSEALERFAEALAGEGGRGRPDRN